MTCPKGHMRRSNRERRQAERNTDRRNADSPASPTMHLHRALFDPTPSVRRMSTAWIHALHRRRDREVGLDLCWALGQREDWPAAFSIPNDCYVNVVHEAHGYRLTLRGVAVLLDNCKRWWMSLLLCVDGVPTAVLRRYGRHAETEQENLVPVARRIEWRRACSIWPGTNIVRIGRRRRYATEWVALNGNTAPLLEIAPGLAWPRFDQRWRAVETPVYVPRGASVDAVLGELAADQWAGWAPAQAIAAYQLGLTRWGYEAWF